MSTHIGYLDIRLKAWDYYRGKWSSLYIRGDETTTAPTLVTLPSAPMNIISMNILYRHGFQTNGDFTEMHHKSNPNICVQIKCKDNLSYFEAIDDEDDDVESRMRRLCYEANDKFVDKPDHDLKSFPITTTKTAINSQLKWFTTFGGPESRYFQAEENDGDSKIR